MRPPRGAREGGTAVLSSEMSLGDSQGALEAWIQGSPSPASGECRQMRSPYPSVARRASGKRGEGKGLPAGADNYGRVAGGCSAERSASLGARSGLGRDKSHSRAPQAGASGAPQSLPPTYPSLPTCVPSPACSFPRTGPASSARGGVGRVPG